MMEGRTPKKSFAKRRVEKIAPKTNHPSLFLYLAVLFFSLSLRFLLPHSTMDEETEGREGEGEEEEKCECGLGRGESKESEREKWKENCCLLFSPSPFSSPLSAFGALFPLFLPLRSFLISPYYNYRRHHLRDYFSLWWGKNKILWRTK